MPKQKTQSFLFIVAVIVAVIILATIFVNDFSRMTALAQDEGGANPNSFPAPAASPEQHFNAVQDLQSLIPEGEIGGQSIQSGFEYIPSSAFRHDGISPASGYRFIPVEGYIRNNSAALMCLAAPVYVPNGVTLTKFSMFFVDDHPISDMAAIFRRRSHTSPGNAAETVASLNFDSNNIDEPTVFEGFTTAITSGREVVNNNFGYYITFCFDPNTGLDQRVYGFRVEYNP